MYADNDEGFGVVLTKVPLTFVSHGIEPEEAFLSLPTLEWSAIKISIVITNTGVLSKKFANSQWCSVGDYKLSFKTK